MRKHVVTLVPVMGLSAMGLLALVLLATGPFSPAFAQNTGGRAASAAIGDTDGDAIVSGVTACRAITEADARLACFDKAAAALGDAVSQKNIVVLDRNAVRETRRSLFGFNLPRLPFFGGRDDADALPETREIQSTIAAASPLRYDNWRITLPDGAVWQTTEAFRGYKTPSAGSAVTITRGPLGSYTMKIGSQRAVRVARQN